MAQTDLATLGLEIRSDGVTVASQRLQGLEAAGQKAANSADRLRKDVSQADAAMKSAASAANTLQTALKTLGVGIGLAYAYKTLSDFEQSMASVKAITRAVGIEYDALRKKAQELGAATRYTAGEAADAMRFLAQAGLTATEVLKSSADVLSLAQAGALGLANAAEISAKALRGFGLQADQMGRVADVMAKAFTVSNTTVQELGEAFTYAAPVATSLKVSIEETTAAIAALSDAGISSSMAGTSLRAIMMRLMAPTATTTKLLEAQGLKMDQLNIKTKGLIPVLETLAKADMGEAAFTIFGQRAGPGFEVLKAALPKLAQLKTSFQDVSGFAAETAKIMDDNVQGAFKNLLSAIEDFILRSSDSTKITIMLKDAMFGLADVIRSVTEVGISGYFTMALGALTGYMVAVRLTASYNAGLVASTLASAKAFISQTAALRFTSIALLGFNTALVAVRTAFMALIASPIGWFMAAGAALGVLINRQMEAKAKSQELSAAFDRLTMSNETLWKSLKQETAVKVATSALETAKNELTVSKKALDDTIDMFKSTEYITFGPTGDEIKQTFDVLENKLVSTKEKIFGIGSDTKTALEIGRQAIAAATKEGASLEDKLVAISAASEKISQNITRIKLSGGNVAPFNELKDVIKEIGGNIQNVIDSNKKVDELGKSVQSIADSGSDTAAQLQKLATILNAFRAPDISLDKEVASTWEDAAQYINKYIASSHTAAREQKELAKQSAQASITILEGRLAEAQATFDAADATLFFSSAFGEVTTQMLIARNTAKKSLDDIKSYLDYARKGFADIQAGRTGTKDSKQESNLARYREAAEQKIIELKEKQNKLAADLIGISTTETRQIELQLEKQKELNDLRDKAKKAGVSLETDKQYQEIVKLTKAIYDQKEAWESLTGPMSDAKAIYDALGDTVGSVGEEMKILQAKMQMATNASDIALLNAQYEALVWNQRMLSGASRDAYLADQEYYDQKFQNMARDKALAQARLDIYDQTTGKIIELQAQMQAIAEHIQLTGDASGYWTSQLVAAGVEMMKLNQQEGLTTFADDAMLALAKIAEGYRGLAVELTDTFGDFFVSFADGFADSIGKAIVYGDSLRESLGNLARTILSELISSLVKLAIQYVIVNALSEVFGLNMKQQDTSAEDTAKNSAAKIAAMGAEAAAAMGVMAATTAASTAAASATTTAWTPAATAVSVASWGAAAVAGTTALTTALGFVETLFSSASGFRSGGYTGNVPDTQIAGVVHGGEYVFNAGAVDRIGLSNLEAMAAGTSMPAFSSTETYGYHGGQSQDLVLEVNIENYGSNKEFEVEQLDERAVRIIARDEAAQAIQEDGGKTAASTLRNPNSDMSKALSNYTKTQRKM